MFLGTLCIEICVGGNIKKKKKIADRIRTDIQTL